MPAETIPSSKSKVQSSIVVASRAEAEAELAVLALNAAKLLRMTADLNAVLATVRTQGEAEMNELNALVAAQRSALETWAWSVKESEFGEKKSLELTHGTLGFRWGKRSLALLSRQKWETVLQRLRGKWINYVRVKEEVDRELILKHSALGEEVLKAADLSAMGLKVVQEETFFIGLKEG